MRRLLPAIGLFLLAPLIAEFLLGDFPLTMIAILIPMAPLYGGGALLIREITRRTGRGWATILILAFSYAVLEEAFTTQTLFNPNYMGLNLHLLEPGYIPALGIGAWWTVFVLTLHTVWSISVSIGLVEAMVPDQATEPWLGTLGLSIDAVLFVLMAIAMSLGSIHRDRVHFVATPKQFAAAGVICILTAIAGMLWPRPNTQKNAGTVPSPWIVGVFALLLTSLFEVTPIRWGWGAAAAYLALDIVAIAIFSEWSRRIGWNSLHRLALAGGAALTYAWHAFTQNPVMGGSPKINLISHIVFASGLIILLYIALRRNMQSLRASAPQATLA